MNCPSCGFEWTYEEDGFHVCSACQFKWTDEVKEDNEPKEPVYVDAHGTVLVDGDTVFVIKDLRFKGSKDVIKQGTKVENIKLVDPSGDGHDIACRVPGFGNMKLKTEFVKKA